MYALSRVHTYVYAFARMYVCERVVEGFSVEVHSKEREREREREFGFLTSQSSNKESKAIKRY